MRLRERLGEVPPLLAAFVGAQWIAVAIFALTIEHNGWLFYQGGDQTWFYTSGWVLVHGHVPETLVGWAWAVAMAPLAALAGANYLAAVPAVVALQFVLLLPVGLLASYAIASRIGGRILGYWAAAWWVAAPYAVIPFFADRYHDTYVEQTLPQALGLTGLGDFPSMICVLASAYFVVRALETDAGRDVLAAGVLAALAIGIKPANGLFVFAPLVALACARRWRRAAEFALALAPGLVVLAVWKHRGSGIAIVALEYARLAAGAEAPDFSPPTFWERVRSYVPLDADQLNYQFLGFREYFYSARVIEYLPVAGAIAVARRSLPLAALLGTWLAAFFLVKGSADAVNVETGSIWRLLMPAWPAYFLLGVSLPLLVPRFGARLIASIAPLGRSGGRIVPLLVGAVLGLLVVAAIVFALLPSDRTQRAAKVPLRSLFLPVDPGFRLDAASAGEGVLELRWRHPGAGGARTFYVLLRSPTTFPHGSTGEIVTQGLLCRTPRGGAARCTIEMDELARTRQPVARDAPRPGRWTYRVGIAANWLDDLEGGDMLVVSEPVDVVVR